MYNVHMSPYLSDNITCTYVCSLYYYTYITCTCACSLYYYACMYTTAVACK